MNPILLKEVRGTLRTRRFFWSFTGTLSVLGAVFLIACLVQAGTGTWDPEGMGKDLFRIVSWTLAGAILLIFPAFSCTALSSERELKSFDLLVTTRMTPFRIVWGKFAAAMVYAGLFLCAALPLIQISFLFGGVSPLEVLAAFAGLAALAAIVTAVSLGLSAPFRGTRWPTALAYAICLGGLGWLTALYGVLTEDSFVFTRMPPGTRRFALFELPAAILLSVGSLSLILAVRATQHPADNRATALRLFYPAFAGAFAWIGWRILGTIAALMRTGAGPFEAWALFWSSLLAALVFSLPWVFLFSCESPTPSRRVELQARRWGRIGSLLSPGSHRGAPYVFAVSALLLLTCVPLLRGIFPGAWEASPLRRSLEGLALGLAILVFLCGTGFFLSTLLRPRQARLALLLLLIATCMLPTAELARRRLAPEEGKSAREVARTPVPAWALSFASPTMAVGSWFAHNGTDLTASDSRFEARRELQQYQAWMGSRSTTKQQRDDCMASIASASKTAAFGRRDPDIEDLRLCCRGWGGRPLHAWVTAVLASSGLALAFLAARRRRRLPPA